MAGIQGTPSGADSMGMGTQATPSVFTPSNQPNANMMSPAVQPMPQPSMGGGKGAGPMQPQKTAMGTPIVYGNVYSNSNQPFNPQPNIPSTTNPSVTEKPYDVLQDPQFYAAADGTTSVPAYAYGTTNVSGYARGTVDVEDPWDWSKSQPMTVPMAATIKPSEAVIPQVVPDQTEQFLGQQAMGMGVNAAAKGIDAAYKAYNAPMTTQAIGSMGTTASGAPVALTNVGALSAPAASSMPTVMGAMTTPMSGALAPVSGLGSAAGAGTGIAAGSAAPIGAGLGASLGTGAAAAEGAALASAGTGAATGAASGAALAGGEAALAALGPVGMVIGGALLAKKLGIF
jgi:hypothetical protein